ncbi:hypothetical protein CJ030_MR4G023318 [Morella rubra]|uniref:C2 and GRAM domain-containing protein n=1 Tax=Morella rubra TaxID=262757 RepID=A0A6A1VUQ8_9ROSI|nr:hypothetical protein CJ030_MR4G023318 [Morella rubra]
MRLYVYVLEARDLPVKDTNVKLRVGKRKSKTRILRNTVAPVWNEEFVLRVHVVNEELVVSVFRQVEESKVLNGSGNLLGRVSIPVWSVAAEKNHTLQPTWFLLESPKTGKFINKDCGKILLTVSLQGKDYETSTNQLCCAQSNLTVEESTELEGACIPCQNKVSFKDPSRKIAEGKHLMKTIAGHLEKIFNKNEEASINSDSSELSSTLSDYEDCMEEDPCSCSFEQGMEKMQSTDGRQDKMPNNLHSGILINQMYVASSCDLNAFLFAPGSQFRKNLVDLQGTTDVQEGDWIWKSGDPSCLTRIVSYTKAATKLVKAVKATEEQTYVRADGREFAVLTRTSSVKLQTHDPQWNEILEFDAMEEPPSVLDVEVFDFDGPFDQATLLGHTEISFVKHTSTELADMWVPLEGKLAHSSQSKIHLRIFLDNDKGVETIKEYLSKMEKEVGKKLSLRSPHKNSTFQKLFMLPPEEFLISSFTCSLKRRMPLQGRLFLSARIVGFYANLFGHKTKFFVLWEDIEDIQVLPPSLVSMGSPTLLIILRRGRGIDARHGAKSQDEEGRLKFYFQSFVSFNEACRTIMALWRTRTLTPDQKAQIAEEQEDQEERSIMLEDAGSVLDIEDVKMSKVYTAELPVNIKSLMEMFDGGKLEHKIMEKSGCLYYATTKWEPVKPVVFERRLSYKFNSHVSVFGGEVACTQQKYPIANSEGWIVKEVMALHGVPFGDYFHVHFKYQIEKSVHAHCACKCDAFMAVTWLKSTKFQQRITRNITENFTNRLKEIFEVMDMERDGQLVFVEFSWSSWTTTGRDPQTDFSGLSMSVKDWPRRKIREKTDDDLMPTNEYPSGDFLQ